MDETKIYISLTLINKDNWPPINKVNLLLESRQFGLKCCDFHDGLRM